MNRTPNRRPSQMHQMIFDLLARIDPDGYRQLLAAYRAEFQPSGPQEEKLVARLAEAAWLLRACPAMEAEILKKNMAQLRPGSGQKATVADAFLRDAKGPRQLSQLRAYENHVEKEYYCFQRALKRW